MRNFNKAALAFVLVGSLGLTACENPNGAGSWGTKQSVGTGLGAVGGGLLGNQFGKGGGRIATTAVGAVLGGLLGNEIGASLDSADRAEMARASTTAYSAPIGNDIVWRNPQSGNSGVITPVNDGYRPNGQYCREFNQKVTIGGQTQSAFGKACQQPDGSWQIVSN